MADGTESSPSDFGGNMSEGISGGEYGGYDASAFGGSAFGTAGLGDGTTESSTYGGFNTDDPMDAFSIEALQDNPAFNGNWNTTNPQVDTDFMDALQGFYAKHKGAINGLGKVAIGALGKSSPLGALASALYGGYNAMSNPQATTGGIMGQTALGGYGPVTGMIGGMIGANVMGNAQATGPAPAGNTSTGDNKMDYFDLGAGLGNVYLQGRNARQTSGLADSLASLYGQDSPYSQMLRQQLTRQDAASGRRSQYGGREVELQARLAALTSQNVPQLAQLRGNANLQRMQQLNQLWALQRMGGGKLAGDLYDKAASGLGSLYDSAQTMYNNYTVPDTSSWYDGGYGGDI